MARENIILPVKKATWADDVQLPRYMTDGSAGMDLHAAVDDDVCITPHEIKLISTGLTAAVPEGYELQVRSRSGLALKHGISVLNSPGTIDSDYRGEIKVILINLGQEEYIIKRNDRIAQLIICPVSRAIIEEMTELPSTERDDGGFGHTG